MKKLLLIGFVVFMCCNDNKKSRAASSASDPSGSSSLTVLQTTFKHRLDSLLPAVKSFVASNGYNEKLFFFADLSLHSGVERFAVVDLVSDSIRRSGLVAHGVGGTEWAKDARFSNTPNSLCSSVGKYKIGAKYNGMFGKSYKLYGLDKTNNKAFERYIVLHGYECVPDERTYPQYLCNSKGCPMVSHAFLNVLSNYIDASAKPILLWIIG